MKGGSYMSVAIRVAAPAPDPAPEQHTFLQSLLYHLLPGIPILACILLLPLLKPDWPRILMLYLAAGLGVVPVQLGILYYHGYRRNGRLSLKGIVLYREPIAIWKLLFWAAVTAVWSALVFRYTASYLDGLLMPAFEWIPANLLRVSGDLDQYAYGLRLAAALTALICNCLVAPPVEELYFRGFLLPRMEGLKGWAPTANSVLFSLYHLFSPWQNLTRIVALIPMVSAVRANRSIWISILSHCALNTFGTIPAVLIWLG